MVESNHDNTYRERTEIRETRSGGNGFLAFIVGALVVIVALLAWMFYGGHMGAGHSDGGATSVSTHVDVNGGGSGGGTSAKTTASDSGSGGSAKAGASTGGSQAGASATSGN